MVIIAKPVETLCGRDGRHIVSSASWHSRLKIMTETLNGTNVWPNRSDKYLYLYHALYNHKAQS